MTGAVALVLRRSGAALGTSPKKSNFIIVTPAKTGVYLIEGVADMADTGLRRCDAETLYGAGRKTRGRGMGPPPLFTP